VLNNILTLNGIGAEGATQIIEGYQRLIEGESDYPVLDALGLGQPYIPDQLDDADGIDLAQ
jgi:hypothetical protein